MVKAPTKKDMIRERTELDLEAFIRLVHPQTVLGHIHSEVISWWEREDAKSHQLLLLPRDHMKSRLVAYRVAWYITRFPWIRVLYVSSTANLAIKQVKFIKDILTSDIYRYYWPEMVNTDEGKREKWTETEFAVDHPLRKAEAVRDPTVFAAGLSTTITGMHCDVAVLDDVVVNENAYSKEGREKVKSQYSLLSSIEGAESKEWAVGTRYHPKDLYNDLAAMDVDEYDASGELSGSYPLYEILERQVENRGDGTGEFLWPRQQRYDGKWFGFDASILAKKRAQYLDRTQFKAQYYNDPNDAESAAINRNLFQYYEQKYLSRQNGKWFFKANRLNVFAAVDFNYSAKEKADYSCVVVVGVDSAMNYYILEIDRFKSEGRISDYFDRILKLHQKWDYRRIRAETTAAQKVIVKDIKENYIRKHGLALTVEEFSPNRYMGSKEERIDAVLQPRYQNGQIWHYMGGNCQILEEELVLQNPAHDDIKDCLASCVDSCVAPTMIGGLTGSSTSGRQARTSLSNSRFGGFG